MLILFKYQRYRVKKGERKKREKKEKKIKENNGMFGVCLDATAPNEPTQGAVTSSQQASYWRTPITLQLTLLIPSPK